MIIVGMDSDAKKRVLEYSPNLPKSTIKHINKYDKIELSEIKPEADEYGLFIVNQVKPYIDKEYRTLTDRQHTYIAGSSCGGNISIYLGFKYQEIFSVIGAFSPAYGVLKSDFFDFVKNVEIKETIKLYHDMGSHEAGKLSFLYLNDQKKFDKLIRAKIPTRNIAMVIDKDALHNEFYWAKRFKYFYRFCLD
nr:alpha/beta hydrolase-fold protein [Bacillota bacterium]